MVNANWNIIGSRTAGISTAGFQSRVAADGGTIESLTCLSQTLSGLGAFYPKSSFVLTPNAYKVNKLYAFTPNDGSGDLAFTRVDVGAGTSPSYARYNAVAISKTAISDAEAITLTT